MNQVKELDEIEDEEAVGKAFVLKTDPVTKNKAVPMLSTQAKGTNFSEFFK